MPTSVNSLPFDIIHAISVLLDIRSYTNLGRTNQRFYQLLKDENAARQCLQRNAPHNKNVLEFLHAQQIYSARQTLSLIFDQQDAIRTASPYSSSTLAYGTEFIYGQGVLCYICPGEIRLLDIFNRSRAEVVISESLLRESLAIGMGLTNLSDDLLRHTTLLNYADDILVIRCEEDTGPGSWLFALDVRAYDNDEPLVESCPRIRLRRRLLSKTKLFVRHNREYLYYGIHSALRADGHHEWLIQGCNLSTGQLVSPKALRLEDFVGSEIRSTACFEIHDGQFYALSNQTSFETEEVDWTSCYHYVCFNLDDPAPELKLRKVWRRQHHEGPINDAWNELSLHPSEKTNFLNIVEVRKEWLGGGSFATRTSYTTAFNNSEDEDLMLTRPHFPISDQLSRTLDEHSKPSFLERPPIRIPKNCHQEYSPASNENYEFIRAHTKHHRYDSAAQAFLDLVTETIPQPNSFRPRDRLRLRIASRVPASPLMLDNRSSSSSGGSGFRSKLYPKLLDHNCDIIPDSDDVFTDTHVTMWPGADAYAPLFELLCPGGRVGSVHAVSDERCVVYMAGTPSSQHNSQRAIIMLSFDPGWGHGGFQRLTADGRSKAKTCRELSQPIAVEAPMGVEIQPASLDRIMNSNKRECSVEMGWNSREVKRPRIDQEGENGRGSAGCENRGFLRKETAMYLRINHGFWLR